MPNFSIGQYQLEINNAPGFNRNSADNASYFDAIYLNGDWTQSALSIGIYEGDELLRTILVGASGGGTGIHTSSLIIDDEEIVTCCSDSLFCISVPALTLKWKTKADDATCFEVFKYQDDYIVHGEMEISRVDKNGVVVWQRSGADIFTTPAGKDYFKVTDFIMATDWNYKQYKFDFDGNIIA